MKSAPLSAPDTADDRMPQQRALSAMRRWITESSFAPGERFPTEQSLANRIGVSRTTIRSALQKLGDEGLLTPAEGRGWHITEHASTKQKLMSNMVGLVSVDPGWSPLLQPHKTSGFSIHVQSGAIDAIGQLGMHSLTLQQQRFLDDGPRPLIEGGLRGIIALYMTLKDSRVRTQLQTMQKAGIPVVGYADGLDLGDIDTVRSDHDEGAYLLTNALIERGCRKILRFWTLAIGDSEIPGWQRERDRGTERACTEHGLEVIEPLLAQMPGESDTAKEKFDLKVRLTAGYLAPYLAEHPDIDAIECISDGFTFQVAAALRLIGGTLKKRPLIAGYDNYWQDSPTREWEASTPDMTIDKQNTVVGQTLVDVLQQRWNNPLDPEPIRRVIRPVLRITDPD